MLLTNLLESWFLASLTSDDRAVGLDDDIALLRPLDNVIPGKPGMNLPLADVDLGAITRRLDVLL